MTSADDQTDPRPDPDPAPRRPRRRWIVLGVAVVLVLGLGTAAAFVLPPLLRPDPADTVEQYFHAWDTADCELYTATSTAAFRSERDATCDAFLASVERIGEDYTVEIESSEVDGGRAVVTARESFSDDGQLIGGTTEYRLVTVDGEWRINSSTAVTPYRPAA